MSEDNHVKDQQIRDLAYKLWEEAGAPEGLEHQFWHNARLLLADSRPENSELSPADTLENKKTTST